MTKISNVDTCEIGSMKWVYSCYDTIKCMACGAEFNEEIIFMNRDHKQNYPKFCPECGKPHNHEETIDYEPKYIQN